MNKSFRNVILTVLLLSLFLNTYLLLSNTTFQNSTDNAESTYPYKNISSEYAYKLFYGTWTITDVVKSEIMLPEAVEHAESRKGEIYCFDEDKVIVEDELYCNFPQYNISIVPTDKWKSHNPAQFPISEYLESNENNIELSYKYPFFCYVQVYNTAHDNFIGFYIVDDNTLILDGGILLKLDRVSHVPNYEAIIGIP